MDNTDVIKKKIESHEFISFDVFDTLLLRPFCKPVDIFAYIETKYNYSNFKALRIKAERRARKKNKFEEVTIEEIYSEMKKYTEYSSVEMEIEKTLLQPNPKTVDYYRYAVNLGKKIIITSDTYLPENLIKECLSINNYSNNDYYFISSTRRKQKKTGNLFLEIIKELKIRPEQIIHIGDNYDVDIKPALDLKIDTVFISKVIDDHFIRCPWHKKYFDTTSYELSAIIMQIAKKNIETINDYWYKFGYEYGGPLCFSFARWVKSITDNDESIKNVLFVARDGYLLKKLYERMSPDSKSYYVYAPRIINILNNIDYEKDHFDCPSQLQLLLNEYGCEIGFDNRNSVNIKEVLEIIEKNRPLLETISEKRRSEYSKYIASLKINKGKTIIVDTITDKFSAQRLISSSLNNECLGAYWVVLLDAKLKYGDVKFVSYQKNHLHTLFNWYLTELILSSPEPPIIGIKDGFPIYAEKDKDEIERESIFASISKGVEDYYTDSLTQSVDFDVSNDVITNYLNDYLKNPSEEDIDQFKKIYFSYQADHKDKRQLMPFKTKWYVRNNNTTIFDPNYYYNKLKKYPNVYKILKKIKHYL